MHLEDLILQTCILMQNKEKQPYPQLAQLADFGMRTQKVCDFVTCDLLVSGQARSFWLGC